MSTYPILLNNIQGNPQKIANKNQTKEAYCVKLRSGRVVFDMKDGDTEFDAPVVTATYDVAPAAESVVYPTSVTVAQQKRDKGFSGNTYNEGDADVSGYTMSVRLLNADQTNATIENAQEGGVRVPAREDTNSGYKTVATVEVAVTVNGKRGVCNVEIKQEASEYVGYDYEAPTIDAYCEDIPASGGTYTEGGVTVTQRRRKIYSSGLYGDWETFYPSEYTEHWSGSVTGANLGTTDTSANNDPLGYLTCYVTANGMDSAVATVPVYQEVNTSTLKSSTYVYQISGYTLKGNINASGLVRACAGEVYALVDISRYQHKVYDWTSGATSETSTSPASFLSGISTKNSSYNDEASTYGSFTTAQLTSVSPQLPLPPIYQLKFVSATYGIDYSSFTLTREANVVESVKYTPTIASCSYADVNAIVGAYVDPDVEVQVAQYSILTSGYERLDYEDSPNADQHELVYEFYNLASAYQTYFSLDASTGRITVLKANRYIATSIRCKVKYGESGTWSDYVTVSIAQKEPTYSDRKYMEIVTAEWTSNTTIAVSVVFHNETSSEYTFSNVKFFLAQGATADDAGEANDEYYHDIGNVTVGAGLTSEGEYTVTGCTFSANPPWWIGIYASQIGIGELQQIEDSRNV